jgi:oxalate decarboxylase/phosphoglucose isomerase-like protein (cupin superfamily)
VRASLRELAKLIPGPTSEEWPGGEPFIEAFRHGSMSVEVFAPRGQDTQTPHDQDELYIIAGGKAVLSIEGVRHKVASGDVLFVPAHRRHNFENISDDFVTWVIFWGPIGGEELTSLWQSDQVDEDVNV